MLAVILKNTILVVLMISIGYFLIDNHLQEMTNGMRYEKKITKSAFTPAVEGVSISKTPMEEIIEAHDTTADLKSAESEPDVVERIDLPSENNNSSRAMKITIDDNMREIYDYVFSDTEAVDSLSQMFDNHEVPSKTELCTENTEDSKFDQMCQDPIKEHHEKVDYKFIQVEPAPNKPTIVEEVVA